MPYTCQLFIPLSHPHLHLLDDHSLHDTPRTTTPIMLRTAPLHLSIIHGHLFSIITTLFTDSAHTHWNCKVLFRCHWKRETMMGRLIFLLWQYRAPHLWLPAMPKDSSPEGQQRENTPVVPHSAPVSQFLFLLQILNAASIDRILRLPLCHYSTNGLWSCWKLHRSHGRKTPDPVTSSVHVSTHSHHWR